MLNLQINSNKNLIMFDRFLSFIVDIAIIYLIIFVFGNLSEFIQYYFKLNTFGFFILSLIIKFFVIPGLYFGISHSQYSQTIGMNFFKLLIKNEDGFNLSFKQSFLRSIFPIISYFLSFVILFIFSLFFRDDSSYFILNQIAGIFVFFNPIFLITIIYLFFSKNLQTLYDKIFKAKYIYQNLVNINENDSSKNNLTISYLNKDNNLPLIYAARFIDIYIQILLIFILNLLINNYFIFDAYNIYSFFIFQLGLNLMIISTLVPIIYINYCLKSGQSIGTKILKLDLTKISSSSFFIRTLIYTYISILVIQVLAEYIL